MQWVVEVACRAVTMLVLAWAYATRPSVTRCPERWYLNGVRPDGTYECRPVLGDPARDLDDARERVEIRDDRSVRGRVYCRSTARPVVIDERTAGCRAERRAEE